MSDWKLYVHYEADPAHTKLVKISNPHTTLLRAVGQEFVESYNQFYGTHNPLSISGVTLQNDRRKQLNLDVAVSKALRDKADLFVVKHDPPETASVPIPTAAVTKDQPQPVAAPVAPAAPASAAPKQKSLFDPRNIERRFQPVVKPFLEQATEAMEQKNYQVAKQALAKVFDYVKGHRQALKMASRLFMEAGHYKAAVEWAQRAVDEDMEDPEAHKALADSSRAAGKHEQAVDAYKATLQLIKQKGRSEEEEQRVQLGLASCLCMLGGQEREMGAGIVREILRADANNTAALELYASILLEDGEVDESVRIALRVLGTSSTNEGIRATLAKALQREGGVETLVAVFNEAGSSGGAEAAFAFLANAVKEHGAVAAAAELLRRSVRLAPTSAAYCLSLVHTLELLGRYDEGLEAARQLLATTDLSLGGGVDLKAIAADLGCGLPALATLTSRSWLEADGWTADGAAAADLHADVVVPDHQKVEYSGDELDLLALLFTAAKVLYVGGALSAAARLCAVVQQARRAAKQELHLTLIRNEAAYFGCVLQLLTDFPPPPPPAPGTTPPLFLLGDSHCLPAAWRIVTLRGEARLLHPLLVTGCKIWHLRDSSTFYPKCQFLNSVAALPDGAQVVTMFGEIDCREGLLLAVQKAKYETIEAAVDAAITIYITVLLRLIKERNFEVFVHPVPPVLDDTRPVVRAFTKRLRVCVNDAARKADAKGRLHYLDFFDDLMVGGQTSAPTFDPDLQFDDTHMAPKYLKYMQAQLDKVPAQS